MKRDFREIIELIGEIICGAVIIIGCYVVIGFMAWLNG